MLAAVVPVLCVLLGSASAADNGAQQTDADRELARRLEEERYNTCCKRPADFGSTKRREPNALDKDPEGWREQGPERYPDAIGVEHCQIQRGQLSQMLVELRAETRRRESAWSKDQVERTKQLIAKKEEVAKRCCADFDRCEREARDAWRTKAGGSGSSK